jgi:DNA-directed RNA polymerase specialized sigma54-like protein
MGEHPSTVSRLIRNKSIDTEWGKLPLLFLCQSKTDVVARLIGEFPKLTDQEVVTKLRDEFDCYIARRTVAYHRGKRLRRNKRHKSPRKKGEGEATAGE